MRKFALGLVLAIALTGLASAQGYGPQGYGPQGMQGQQAPATPFANLQAKTLEGKLAFIDTRPAIVTKDLTYFLDMRGFFYYAYTDGLKSGDSVKADGYVLPTIAGQDKPGFMVTKAVINGKTYDFTASFSRGMRGGHAGMMGGAYGSMMGQGGRGTYGPMMGGRGGRW